MTIYVVTGDGPRCGSAMMMQALVAGGMEAVVCPSTDDIAHAAAEGDYHPNPSGLWELDREVMYRPGFPGDPLAGPYAGKLIKVFPPPWMPLDRLPEGGTWQIDPETGGSKNGAYRLIWMHRPLEERAVSFKRFHRSSDSAGFAHDPQFYASMRIRDDISRRWFEVMRSRPDIHAVRVEYGGALAEPLEYMTAIRDAGWPIEPDKAAAVVDPGLRHF